MKCINSAIVIFLFCVTCGTCASLGSDKLVESKLISALHDPNEVMVQDQVPFGGGGQSFPSLAQPIPYPIPQGFPPQSANPIFPPVGGGLNSGFNGYPGAYPYPWNSPCGSSCNNYQYYSPCSHPCQSSWYK